MATKVLAKKGTIKKAPEKKGAAKPAAGEKIAVISRLLAGGPVPVGITTTEDEGKRLYAALDTSTGRGVYRGLSFAQFIDGEFRGDFTRNTFDPENHYSRVLMQQGRVQLDADWNEQTSILLHYLQTLAADIIGPFGGPEKECGFQIRTTGPVVKNDFHISPGRYYVDGVLVENEEITDYTGQLSGMTLQQVENDKKYLVYLDIWERSLSCIGDPGIREVALNGPDTATRARIEWMVRVTDTLFPKYTCLSLRGKFDNINHVLPMVRGRLKPALASEDTTTDICNIHPDTKYRGFENQLYRVEIHTGGIAGNATFKWSRENGSVEFPILGLNGDTLVLGNLGKDESLSLKPGDFVEVVDDNSARMNYDFAKIIATAKDKSQSITIPNTGKLYKVRIVDISHLTVTLDKKPENWIYNKESHPLLRRWDQKKPTSKDDNCIIIEESNDTTDKPFELEDGISIRFYTSEFREKAKSSNNKPNTIYIPGNYWLIPARVITGGPDWPITDGDYTILPPHGIIHYCAPLGKISVGKDGTVTVEESCTCTFKSFQQIFCDKQDTK